MKNFILSAAIVAVIGLPSIVIAQTAPRTTITVPAPGTLVCHPVKAGEAANATMGTNQLRCRPVNMTRITAAVRTIRTVMHQQQASAAQMKSMQGAMDSLNSELQLPNIPGGNGGVED